MANVYGTPESPQNPPPEPGPGNIPPVVERIGPLGREADPKARMWAMFCHLAGLAWLLPIVMIVDVVFLVIAAIKANDGEHYRYPYPLIIRFVK